MPYSCIEEIANEENYRLLMEGLDQDPGKNNKFFYDSTVPCVIPAATPTKKEPDLHSKGENTGTTGGLLGSTGSKPGSSEGTTGGLVGSTGLKPGRILFHTSHCDTKYDEMISSEIIISLLSWMNARLHSA